MSYVRQVSSWTVATEQVILAADAINAQDIFALTVANRSVTDVDVIIRDSSAGNIVWRWAVKAGTSFGFNRARADAARQSAKNANWTIQVSSAVTSIEVTVEASSRPA